MKNFVIVIGRQYGGGGRKIGRILADRLGVSYYDKELLSEAARQHGFSEHLFTLADEKRPSLFRSLLHMNYGLTSTYYGAESFSNESLYQAQSRVIRSICEQEPCVIVGRTADYVMRNHPGLLSIFIHAPEEHRAKAIVKRGEAPTIEEGIELARRFDRERHNYYNYFTNRSWGMADNYDLTVDSSKFTEQQIVDMVIANLKSRGLTD